MATVAPETPPPFEEHLTSAFQDLRSALERLLVSAGVDPSEPQEAARRLGLNRNLTWKLARVINGSDLYEALQHLPGSEGLDIIQRAASAAGVKDPLVSEVRSAQKAFDRVVEVHTGDRATLDLILDNMGSSAERLEESRRLAFRGNSGVWGAQARVRVTSCIVAPSPDRPDMVDSVMIAGVVDFRRLRPNVRWPLFRPRVYTGTGETRVSPAEAIDPAFQGAAGPMFLGGFCRPFPPPVLAVPDGDSVVYELAEAPVGNTGAVTCYLGSLVRCTGERYATPDDPVADLSAQVSMPAEHLLFDLLLHRDLQDWGEPETFVIGQLLGSEPRVSPYRIPLGQRTELIAGQPPPLRCPQVPEYEEVMRFTLDRLGWSAREFRVLRLLVKYPPIHSSAVMRFRLPPPPRK
ncbi:MAG: hypothetical protein AB7K52_10630 [Phycisphaerales bacterium]